MTMADDQMDRDLERTRPSGEPAGTRAGATYPDDDEQRRPEEAEPAQAPAGGRPPAAGPEGFDLLGDGELTSIRDRWEGVQATFVDDPAGAARQADTMVGEVLDHLQRRHRELHDEAGRATNGEADTEALRVQFLRYRSFFRTLLG
jgi:hypothetical protein